MHYHRRRDVLGRHCSNFGIANLNPGAMSSFDPASIAWDLLLHDRNTALIRQTAAGTPVAVQGDLVGEWVDARNSSRKATAVGAQRGTYGPVRGISFDTNQWLDLAANITVLGSDDVELFVVGRRAQAGSFIPIGRADGTGASIVDDGVGAEFMQLNEGGAVAVSEATSLLEIGGFLASWRRASVDGKTTFLGSGFSSDNQGDTQDSLPMTFGVIGKHTAFSATDSYYRLIALKIGTPLTAAERANFYAWCYLQYGKTLP